MSRVEREPAAGRDHEAGRGLDGRLVGAEHEPPVEVEAEDQPDEIAGGVGAVRPDAQP
jgi:hypothetical protein